MTATTHSQLGSVNEATLYVAFEVSQRSWTLAMTTGLHVESWVRTVTPGDWGALQQVLEKARRRFMVSPAAPVVSCYEAGRDGFWIHRALQRQGLKNRVVDSASIEVNRRARRNKTDRIDARKLVILLVRVCLGDGGAWREVRVPTVEEEAARHVSRDRSTLITERTRLLNQLQGWVVSWGARVPSDRAGAWWQRIHDWAGRPLPAPVQARLARATARVALVEAQIAELDDEQAAAVATAPTESAAGRLRRLKGVGVISIATLLDEGLVWRQFTNRRQVGGLLGFAPSRFDSGESARDQGISRAGNRRLQCTMVQLAWRWVRWQPHTAITRWFTARFGTGRRARRIGIVGVARRLLILLWRYATTGTLPDATIVIAR